MRVERWQRRKTGSGPAANDDVWSRDSRWKREVEVAALKLKEESGRM